MGVSWATPPDIMEMRGAGDWAPGRCGVAAREVLRVDAVLPRAFAALHERYRTPHVALIIQAAAASFLFLASVFLSIGGGETTVQESYDILVNLTILIYFVPYLYLFAAWIRLRQRERSHDESAFTIPGGLLGVWGIASCGFVATLVAIGLVFVPPPDTENMLNYEANLAGQSLLLIVVGIAFYLTASRRRDT